MQAAFFKLYKMGNIFDIQHFCTHDGPGIRTTVFFKGCSLHCEWCHNPESQSARSEVIVNSPLCIHCSLCEEICPHHDSHNILLDNRLRNQYCHGCTLCESVCPTGALELAGRKASIQEIISEVLKDKDFYENSGGGVTFSGGEPMNQATFLRDLLIEGKKANLNTAIETSGNGDINDYKSILPYTDLFLWDIKILDEALYQQYTGGELDKMLFNLETLLACGAKIQPRALFIPEIHLQPKVLEQSKAFFHNHTFFIKPEVIPYHILGNAKRIKLGLPEKKFREPNQDEIDFFREAISTY